MFQKIPHVDTVGLVVLESFPPKLLITSIGQVPTSGWSNPQLIPYLYVTPPADGIWDFDFAAQPPSGISISLIQPIAASYIWTEFDQKKVKGVRVHSSNNEVVASLDRVRQVSYPILDYKFIAYAAVSLEIDFETRFENGELCVKVKVKVKVQNVGSGTVSLPEVCLSAEGVCSRVNSGGGDVRAEAEICWRGAQVCANVTGKIKLFGTWYETTEEKCVDV